MHILHTLAWALGLVSNTSTAASSHDSSAKPPLAGAWSLLAHSYTRPVHEGVQLHDLPRPWFERLVRDYLTEIERLQLFRASTGLAACVLQHASGVKLTLDGEHSPRQLATLQSLLATEDSRSNLLLVLAGAAPVGTRKDRPQLRDLSAVWSGLLHLTLRGVRISAELLEQLQACTHLHTLRLDGPLNSQQCYAKSPLTITFKLPSLHKLELSSSADENLPIVQQLFGNTITHLSMDLYGQAVPPFKSVTHLTVPLLTDGILNSLGKLPRLTHVTANALQLFDDHSSSGIALQHLEVSQGVSLHMLARLPLEAIQKLTLHAGLTCNLPAATAQEAAQRLGSCPGLTCIPGMHSAVQQGPPVFYLSGSYTPELILACAKSLVGGLGLCDLTAGLALLPWVPLLPSTVTSVWFKCLSYLLDGLDASAVHGEQVAGGRGMLSHVQRASGAGRPHGPVQQAAVYWRTFIDLLPRHVTQIGIHNALGDESSRCSVAGLVAALAHAQRPIRLTLKTE